MPSLPESPLPGPVTSRPTEKVAPPATAAAFDAWLKNELGRLYENVLSEPVPEALLALLRRPPAKPR